MEKAPTLYQRIWTQLAENGIPISPTAPHDPDKGPTALLVPLPHCTHTTVQGGLTDQVNRVPPVSLVLYKHSTEVSSGSCQLR